MMQAMRRWLQAVGAVALVSSALAAAAQDFPARQVRVVVPQSPGGVTDVIARAVAQRLSELWGQPVIVENKAGANYQIGANFVAKAEPDGTTLLVMSEAFSINPLLSARLPYDPVKDFAPVTGLISINHALVAHPSLPANSVKELIELARAKPGEINYATYGVGSTGHLNMEMFQSRAGVKLFPVHYKGATPALTDVMAGHIPLMFISVASVVEPWKAGKVKLLGTGSVQRLPALPEVPTIAESALPDFRALTWFGLFTTGGTPRETVAKINGDVQRIVADPAFRARFLAPQMFEPLLSSPEHFAAFLSAETQKWGKVIREANVRVD
jgi:tripartite-type tricarboxylate transporter receptor subunit TctC